MIKAVIFDMYETLITHYDSPLYFTTQMAADADIPAETFRELWGLSETERTIGKLSFENVIRDILITTDRYSDVLHEKIVANRIATKQDCFKHLHPEILPMLDELKQRGIKIGLISNCYSEEAVEIRNSVLYPYFDVCYLSYEQGLKKPDPEIFKRCMDELHLTAEECIFVGDGGSQELEASGSLGMKPLQAVWYFKEGTLHRIKPMEGYIHLKTPMDVLHHI